MSVESTVFNSPRSTIPTIQMILTLGRLSSEIEHYEVNKRIGRGKYSDVYDGYDAKKNLPIVVKMLKPVRKQKIAREIKILRNLSSCPHIIQLYDVCLDKQSRTTALIFENFSLTTLKKMLHQLSDLEIRLVIYQVLQSLSYTHSKGIIHRDIKPTNIIINSQTKEIKIIDWGLSEFYLKGQEYNTRVSSRPYKSPELLINNRSYDFAMDIWSLGCVMGAMIFRKNHMFLGRSNPNQLQKIVQFFGMGKFGEFFEKYEVEVDEFEFDVNQLKSSSSFEKLVTEENSSLANEEALDLLKKMLTIDQEFRINAKEAMKHAYFNPIRNKF